MEYERDLQGSVKETAAWEEVIANFFEMISSPTIAYQQEMLTDSGWRL